MASFARRNTQNHSPIRSFAPYLLMALMLTEDQFGQALAQHIQNQLAAQLQSRQGLTLKLRLGQSNVELNLHNFYHAYQQAPDQLELVADTLVRSLRSYEAARAITSFDDLRDRVYPMLKPLALLVTVRERKLPMIVYRPFLADLLIAYVIDEPTSVAYITEQHLDRWQISQHELHEQAIANLKRRTEERGNYTVAGEGAQRLIVCNTQDGYDATRLLLPGLLAGWRDQFPGQMVIGVPNRDFLVVFSDADRQILASVAHQVQLDSAQREHGLTDQLFTLVNGEVREYMWE